MKKIVLTLCFILSCSLCFAEKATNYTSITNREVKIQADRIKNVNGEIKYYGKITATGRAVTSETPAGIRNLSYWKEFNNNNEFSEWNNHLTDDQLSSNPINSDVIDAILEKGRDQEAFRKLRLEAVNEEVAE